MTLVFAMAVPAGWGDETRRYVDDRISVNLQAFQVTYEQHVQTLVQEAVNSVKAFFDIAVQAMNDKADQVGRSTMQNEAWSTSNLRALTTHFLGSRDSNLHRHRLSQLRIGVLVHELAGTTSSPRRS